MNDDGMIHIFYLPLCVVSFCVSMSEIHHIQQSKSVLKRDSFTELQDVFNTTFGPKKLICCRDEAIDTM